MSAYLKHAQSVCRSLGLSKTEDAGSAGRAQVVLELQYDLQRVIAAFNRVWGEPSGYLRNKLTHHVTGARWISHLGVLQLYLTGDKKCIAYFTVAPAHVPILVLVSPKSMKRFSKAGAEWQAQSVTGRAFTFVSDDEAGVINVLREGHFLARVNGNQLQILQGVYGRRRPPPPLIECADTRDAFSYVLNTL